MSHTQTMDELGTGSYTLLVVRRFVALLVSLALLLPSGAASASVVFCKMTRRTASTCCCDKAHQAELAKLRRGTDGETTLEQTGCCERRSLSATADRTGVTVNHDSLSGLAAPVLAILPASVWVERLAGDFARAPANARAPPPARSAPLFILNRAFLS